MYAAPMWFPPMARLGVRLVVATGTPGGLRDSPWLVIIIRIVIVIVIVIIIITISIILLIVLIVFGCGQMGSTLMGPLQT